MFPASLFQCYFYSPLLSYCWQFQIYQDLLIPWIFSLNIITLLQFWASGSHQNSSLIDQVSQKIPFNFWDLPLFIYFLNWGITFVHLYEVYSNSNMYMMFNNQIRITNTLCFGDSCVTSFYDSSSSLFQVSSDQYFTLFSYEEFFILHKWVKTWYLSICVWLTSLIITSSSVHVAANDFFYGWILLHCVHTIFSLFIPTLMSI